MTLAKSHPQLAELGWKAHPYVLDVPLKDVGFEIGTFEWHHTCRRLVTLVNLSGWVAKRDSWQAQFGSKTISSSVVIFWGGHCSGIVGVSACVFS